MTAVNDAISGGILKYEDFESGRELIGQSSFLALGPKDAWPDVMRYHFTCRHCGRPFQLFAETYHGSGGAWKPST